MNPQCAGVREGLSALLDGALSPSERILLSTHLKSCASCRSERAALESTRALVASAGKVRAPRAWVDRAVRAAGASKPAARTDLGGALPDRRHAWRISRPWAVPGLAAAATLVVVLLALRLMGVAGRVPVPDEAPGQSPLPVIANSPARDSANPAPSVPGATPQREVNLAERPPGLRKDQAGPEAPRPSETLARAPGSVAQVPIASPHAPATVVSKVAVADEIASEPVERIALAQIRFPVNLVDMKAKEAPRREGIGNEIDKRGSAVGEPRAAAPPVKQDALMARAAASPARGRTIRVRVTLDGDSRVLAAEIAEEHPSREGADLVARLPGATIDLGGAGGKASGDQPGEKKRTLTPDRARTVAVSPSTREVILEIDLGDEGR